MVRVGVIWKDEDWGGVISSFSLSKAACSNSSHFHPNPSWWGWTGCKCGGRSPWWTSGRSWQTWWSTGPPSCSMVWAIPLCQKPWLGPSPPGLLTWSLQDTLSTSAQTYTSLAWGTACVPGDAPVLSEQCSNVLMFQQCLGEDEDVI